VLAESAGLLFGVSHFGCQSPTLSSQRLNFPQNPFHQDTQDWAWTCRALCMHCATHLHATNSALNSVMPHCHDAQCFSGTNAHQTAARHGKQCQLHGGLGRQFRECRNVLRKTHARRHDQYACRHRTSVTCTAVAEAAPEIAERGEHTASTCHLA